MIPVVFKSMNMESVRTLMIYLPIKTGPMLNAHLLKNK